MNTRDCNKCNMKKECRINNYTTDTVSTSASCYYDQGLFWDEVNKVVTTNPQNTPIKKWNGLGWLESWWVEIGKTVIDFPYASEEICANNINNKRQQFFDEHKCAPIALRCIMIPTMEYENYMANIISLT